MLKSRPVPLLVLAAPLLLASPALAYTLEYDSTNGTWSAGWQQQTLAFDYDYSACPAGISASQLSSALEAAIQLWNSVATSGLTLSQGSPVSTSFSEAEVSTSPNPVIFCDANFGADTGLDASTVLGIGHVDWNSTGKNYRGFIVLNAQADATANIATQSSTRLEIVLAHELGHILGLGHPPVEAALMYYDLSTKTSLALAQDDQDGVTYLYPKTAGPGATAMGCGSLAVKGLAERRRAGLPDSSRDPDDRGPTGGGGAGAEASVLLAALTGIWLAFSRRARRETRRALHRAGAAGR